MTMTMTKPTSVAIAKQMIQRFERDRDALVERRSALAKRRSGIAYDAHAGDASAVKLLDDLARQDAELETKIATIDDAINEARRRLDQARAYEASQKNRDKARALRAALARFTAAGKGLDRALEQVVAGSAEMRDALTQINRLGCSHPSHAQLDSLGSLALRTALTATAWNRYFERTAPGERKTFAALVSVWATMVERHIASRLGGDEEEAA
jgi:hypothetical protein